MTATAAAPSATLAPPPLPCASWTATVAAAPRDLDLHGPARHARLRPRVPVPLYAVPDVVAAPFAELPTDAAPGLPTWLPVVGGRPGWALVLLPCRPDGAVGWVQLDRRVEQEQHRCHIEIDTHERTVTLISARDRRTWPAGVGKSSTPTPRGRTFVLGQVAPARGLVDRALVLAAHAPTHLAHGAGMAAVGVHTWPGAEDIRPATDGCVIVPPDVMTVLTTCALPGTAVLIR